MTVTRRPRVAAIGLEGPQAESIAPLCGTLRTADSVAAYVHQFSWTETDIVVLGASRVGELGVRVHLFANGRMSFRWSDAHAATPGGRFVYPHYVERAENTERETRVPTACPEPYKRLAGELSRQLNRAFEPPATLKTSRPGGTSLIETTSGRPVASRLVLTKDSTGAKDQRATSVALLLPESAALVAWFTAFLHDLHETDPVRVPHPPPRLSHPSDWYTPQETAIADRIADTELELNRLSDELAALETRLTGETQQADQGVRRVLWADGDELVAAVHDILFDLGFTVRDMDAEVVPGEPKREDLRLTLEGRTKWGAVVEVKGYTNGIKTSDSRQIREHLARFIREEGREPDLTVWISNSFREIDPSSRPAPDQNVDVVAGAAGVVHVMTTDLYRQWAFVAANKLKAEDVVQSLLGAAPGLWTPLIPSGGEGDGAK